MNLRFLQILTVLILLFHGKAMAEIPPKIADRLPETKEDLDLYEGMEIPYDEAVENIFQLRNMEDLYEDVKFKLLCRAYIDERKYEIYSLEFKYSTRLLKEMYLFMSAGEKKYPKALKIYSEEYSLCSRHFYINNNIIEINYIYDPGEIPALYNEFYDLRNINLIKSSLKDWNYRMIPAPDDDIEDI